MRTLYALALGFFILSSNPVFAALSNAAKTNRIMSLAIPMRENAVFYRWQSKVSGDNLLKTSQFTDKLFKYFMTMKVDAQHFKAGRGIYVSENPHSASEFIRGGGDGSLIEVVIQKGMPYLDLGDPRTLNQLTAFGLTIEDVFNLDPPLMVKYAAQEKWWVIKAQQGVQFRRFHPERLKSRYLFDVYNKIRNVLPRTIYATAIAPELARRARTDITVLTHPNFLAIVDEQQAAKSVLALLQNANAPSLVTQIRSFIERERVLKAILQANPQFNSLYSLYPIQTLNSSLSATYTQLPSARAIRLSFAEIQDPNIYLQTLSAFVDQVQPNRLEFLLKLGPASLALKKPTDFFNTAQLSKYENLVSKITLTENELLQAAQSPNPSLQHFRELMSYVQGRYTSPQLDQALTEMKLQTGYGILQTRLQCGSIFH